jgi:gamma-glutamylaminecyclotransferase
MRRVFVYGTFLRGKANHAVLTRLGARFVCAARTSSPRTLVDLGPYPAMLPADASRDRSAVHGELYEIDEAALASLDEFEGCPDLYRRERITLDAGEAETYVFARRRPKTATMISSGRYEPTGTVLDESARDEDLGDG